jgi:hypothetical protein
MAFLCSLKGNFNVRCGLHSTSTTTPVNLALELHTDPHVPLARPVNLVPLMSVLALIATFAYARPGRYLPGALLGALLVAWYIVVGQATQAA